MPNLALSLPTGLYGTADYPWTVTLGGTVVSPEWPSVELAEDASGEASYFRFRVWDPDNSLAVVERMPVRVQDNASDEPVFLGFVQRRSFDAQAVGRWLEIEAVSIGSWLDEILVPLDTRPSGESDLARIGYLWGRYAREPLSFDLAFVTQVRASMPADTFDGLTLRTALDQVAAQAGAAVRWYVDAAGRLHWFSGTEASLVAPYNVHVALSPAGGNIAPDDLEVEYDGKIVNRVYVRGADEAVSGWHQDDASVAARGPIEGYLDAPSADTAEKAESVARMYLGRVAAARVRGAFTTGHPYDGWRAGQGIVINSTQHDLAGFATRIVRITHRFTLGDGKRSLRVEFGAGAARLTGRTTDNPVPVHESEIPGPTALVTRRIADLTVAGANQVVNSSFENTVGTEWELGANWAAGHTPSGGQTAFAGTRTARAALAAQTAGALLSAPVLVDRLDDWWVSAWSFVRAYTSGTARMEVREYDAGDVLLATTVVADLAAADDEWRRLSIRFGPNDQVGRRGFHASTVAIRVAFLTPASATLSWDVDGVQVERGSLLTAYAPRPQELVDGSVGATQIADDAVTTQKLAANAVVAGKIAAGAITTQALDARAVTADKLAAQIILSSLLATAASGRRVEIDESGIVLYDADDTPLVRIPTNGDPVYVRGEVIASSLVSETAAEFRSAASLAAGGVMTVQAGVVKPTAAPVLAATLASLTTVTLPNLGHGIGRDSGAGSYWIGADPSVSDYVAHEVNGTSGAIIRSITKTGTITTKTATLGPTTKVADTTQAYSGTSNSQVATPLTMPRDGRITKVSAWLAGYTGDQSCRVAIWNTSGTLLANSSTFTAAQRTFSNGNDVRYERDLTSPLEVASGATIWAGFLRTTGTPGFFYSRDDGAGKTTKRGSGLAGNMTSIATDTASMPNVYITYEYDEDTSLEGVMGRIVGVATDGTTVFALDAAGVLFRYQRSDLAYLGKTDLSSYIGGTKANAGLFWDATASRVVVTTATGTSGTDQVRFVLVNASGVYQSTINATGFAVNGSTATVRGGARINDPLNGSTATYWVPVSGTVRAFVASTGAYVANREFGSSASCADGLTHDGTVFRGWSLASPTRVWTYTDWDWTTASGTYWVAYSWYKSTATVAETQVGPYASLAMRRRERISVTNAALPTVGGVDRVRVYMLPNASQPGAGAAKLQATGTGTSRVLSTYNSGGAADSTTNTFPAGGTAEIRSAASGWVLRGDGGIRLGGSAFPSGGVTDDLFFRTDRGAWHAYDGAAWVGHLGVVAIPFSWSGTLPGSGAVDLPLSDSSVAITQNRLPFDGRVVGVTVTLGSARTAGTLVAQALNASTGPTSVGPSATIDGTVTNNAMATASAAGSADFSAQNLYRLRVTTTSFTPTANSVKGMLYIALRL